MIMVKTKIEINLVTLEEFLNWAPVLLSESHCFGEILEFLREG